MATVPSTQTVAAAAKILAAHENTNVKSPLDFLLAPPSAFIYLNTVPANLTTATTTLITFDTAVYDTDSAGVTWTVGTNPSRITPKTAGFFEVKTTCSFATNATGIRFSDVRKNVAGNPASGTRVDTDIRSASSALQTICRTSTVVQFNGTSDYIELFAQQTSGGGLALYCAASASSWIGSVGVQMRWLNS